MEKKVKGHNRKDPSEKTKWGHWGPLDFKSRIAKYEGSVMSIATREVVTIPPTMNIKSAADTMANYRFRRLPVSDPGKGKILGIIGSSDIVDFLGGGDKFLLISKKYDGNFLAAINDSVTEIMVTDVTTLKEEASIENALRTLLESGSGGIVIVDDEHMVKGMVTERDFVFLLAEKTTGKKVEDYMTTDVITTTRGTSLGDAAKIMVRNSFRRLPVTEKDFLRGIITTRMIIDFLSEGETYQKIVKNEIDEILKTRVDQIMKEDVPTVAPGTELGEVASLMEVSGVGTVCVVEDSNLLGILTERDIIEALLR